MLKRTKVALVAGMSALGLIGTGAAFAAASSPAAPSPAPTAPSPTAPSTAKAHQHRALLDRVEHGEVTLSTKQGDKVVDLQRGTVTAVSATSVTVRSTDGFTATYTVGSGTKVRKDKAASTIGNVADGDRVRVVATKTGNTDTATRIGDAGPAPAGH